MACDIAYELTKLECKVPWPQTTVLNRPTIIVQEVGEGGRIYNIAADTNTGPRFLRYCAVLLPDGTQLGAYMDYRADTNAECNTLENADPELLADIMELNAWLEDKGETLAALINCKLRKPNRLDEIGNFVMLDS